MIFDYEFWKSCLDVARRVGMRSKVKIVAFLRILGSGRFFHDLGDYA